MAHVIKIMFSHQNGFYSVFVNIINEFETDFIDIEFLDEEIIDIISIPYLSYAGEGYKSLPIYRSRRTRSILNSICQVINHAQFICNNEEVSRILDEEFVRQN